MANCPKCNKEWLWDCQQDCYLEPNGTYVVGSEQENLQEGTTKYVCSCGQVLAIGLEDADGFTVYNHPSWADIDWAQAKHRFKWGEPKCTTCFDSGEYRSGAREIITPCPVCGDKQNERRQNRS